MHLKFILILMFMGSIRFVTLSQSVQMDIGGALQIHHAGEAIPDPGTIRWNDCDHECMEWKQMCITN